MTILLLSFLVVGPLIALGYVLARGERGGQLHERALAVAHVGGSDLDDVVTYTEDCSTMACMLLARRVKTDPALLRQVVSDAVTQVDSVQRATRLRRALVKDAGRQPRRWATWPDLMLWAAGLLDADVIARLIAWRGEEGISDLKAMTEQAIERFSATVPGADEAPLVEIFAEELVRLGLLEAQDLEPLTDGEAVPTH
jgi:hypothetical protein